MGVPVYLFLGLDPHGYAELVERGCPEIRPPRTYPAKDKRLSRYASTIADILELLRIMRSNEVTAIPVPWPPRDEPIRGDPEVGR
jgi:hypothetical protein